MSQQFSLFGAAAVEPTVADLGGLLLAGGHWVRGGAGARLSIVVSARWRAEALAAEFAQRRVADPDNAVAPAEDGWTARTGFSPELLPAAGRWSRGANEAPPPDFALTPGGLRLWVLATGRPTESGYLLGTARPDDSRHLTAGAQLSRYGLAAVSVARGGPGWRITSARRVRRLCELLGAPPPGGEQDWPQLS